VTLIYGVYNGEKVTPRERFFDPRGGPPRAPGGDPPEPGGDPPERTLGVPPKWTPREAKTDPGEAKTDPGEAKTDPGEAKTEKKCQILFIFTNPEGKFWVSLLTTSNY